MKYIKLMSIVLFFACNNGSKQGINDQTDLNETKGFAYPEIVDSLNVKTLYDIAKWNLYCIYCDDIVRFLDRTINEGTITYASLDLRLENIYKSRDTIEMHFSFYHDLLKCDVNSVRRDGKIYADGIVFKNDSVASYTTTTTMRYFSDNYPKSRFANPLQPDVLAYIKNNQNKLHNWFRHEAKRKGLIQ